MASHKDVGRADAHAPGVVEDYVEFDEVAAPSTPASGKVVVYAKTDGVVYQKDDAGVETPLAVTGSVAVQVFDEGAAPSTPAAGTVVIYAKTDGLMYQKDDAGAETALGGGGAGGAMEVIDTVTVAAASELLIDLPAGYTGGIKFYGHLVGNTGAQILNLQVGPSSTPSSSAVYDWGYGAAGDSTVNGSGDGATAASCGGLAEDQAGPFEAFIAPGYDDASLPTSGLAAVFFTEGTGQWNYRSGFTYKTTDTVDVVRIFPSSGTITGSIVAVGIA